MTDGEDQGEAFLVHVSFLVKAKDKKRAEEKAEIIIAETPLSRVYDAEIDGVEKWEAD